MEVKVNRSYKALIQSKYEYPENWTCNRKNCKYRNTAKTLSGHCSYLQITGHSRIADLPEGPARYPANCPKFEKKERKKNELSL